MTVGEDRRRVVFERGTEAFDIVMGYAKKFVPAVGGSPSPLAESASLAPTH